MNEKTYEAVQDITKEEIVIELVHNLGMFGSFNLGNRLFEANGSMSYLLDAAVKKTIQAVLLKHNIIVEEDVFRFKYLDIQDVAFPSDYNRHVMVDVRDINDWLTDKKYHEYTFYFDRIPAIYLQKSTTGQSEQNREVNFNLLFWAEEVIYQIVVQQAPYLYFSDEEETKKMINASILNELFAECMTPWDYKNQGTWVGAVFDKFKLSTQDLVVVKPKKWTNYMLPEFTSKHNEFHHGFTTGEVSPSADLMNLMSAKLTDYGVDVEGLKIDPTWFGPDMKYLSEREMGWINFYVVKAGSNFNRGDKLKKYALHTTMSWRSDFIEYLDELKESGPLETGFFNRFDNRVKFMHIEYGLREIVQKANQVPQEKEIVLPEKDFVKWVGPDMIADEDRYKYEAVRQAIRFNVPDWID